MKTFPKTLLPDEEKYYLQRYREGDQGARNILIERNLRLVAHLARKYQGGETETEDLLSIGIIGLIKAVSTFDCSKNNRLATYAARCIENELLMTMRANKKQARETSIYEKIGIDSEGRELRLMDVLETEPVDVLERLEIKRNSVRLYEYIPDMLTEREQKVISWRYGLYGCEELTQREIAVRLGISRSYVSRIEKNALMKLKKCLEEKNLEE